MGVPISTIWTQYFPPDATLTEKNLPNQRGKVFLVTGGNSGVGFELYKILYDAGGKVYMAARSEKSAQAAIQQFAASSSNGGSSGGELHFLHLDVADLDCVKQTAEIFKSKESRLHVLWNNAGASMLPTGSYDFAGQEAEAENEVRVMWFSSILTEISSPKDGVDMRTIDAPPQSADRGTLYAATKAGNYFLASKFARRYTERTGIISVTQNPGNLRTRVWRNVGWLTTRLVW